MDCSRPGSSVHGTSQSRVLEWGAFVSGGLKELCMGEKYRNWLGEGLTHQFSRNTRCIWIIICLSRDTCWGYKKFLTNLMAGSAILYTTQIDNGPYQAYLKFFPVPSTVYCPYMINKPLWMVLWKYFGTIKPKCISLIYIFSRHLIRKNVILAATYYIYIYIYI